MQKNNDSDGKSLFKKDCVFCEIYLKEKKKIIHETPHTFSFHDRSKGGCYKHILVCPKKHIKNVNTIKKEDLEIVKEIKNAGKELAKKFGEGHNSRFGFHKPPFYSVTHLHMHVCVEPISGLWANNITFGWNLKRIDAVIKELEQK